jgi:hypothetical protein
MMNYGQFCPIAKAAEIVAERWTPLDAAQRDRHAGSSRHAPLVGPTALSWRVGAG